MDTEKMKNQKPKKFVISVSSSAEHIVSKYYNIFGNFILCILFYHNAPGTALSRFLYRFLHYIIYVYGYIYIFNVPIFVVLDLRVSWVKVFSRK